MNNNFHKTEYLGYVPSLDGLRAVAIFMVMLSHANFQFGINGGIGVSLFFTLSGFLITKLLLEEYKKKSTISIVAFYIRRTMRLFPALYLMLIILLIYAVCFKTGDTLIQIKNDIFYSFIYIYNIASSLGWVKELHFLYHMWTLGIEEQFYLLWPGVLLFLLGFRNYKFILYFLLFTIFGLLSLRYYDLLPLVPAAIINEQILIGCFGAVLYSITSIKMNNYYNYFVLVLFIFICFIGIAPIKRIDNYQMISNTVAISTLLIIFCLLLANNFLLNYFLSLKPIVFLGKLSYSLYIWHLPIFKLFSYHSTLHPYLSFILKFFVSLVIAYLSWRYIEKYTIAYGRKISNRILNRVSVRDAL